ncbi:MAG TPA: histidine kinase [Vicinamibacterales bacterium]|nr:histidine kinase [Vicinamibacterales bacterium]
MSRDFTSDRTSGTWLNADLILDAFDAYVCAWDGEDRCVYANRAVQELWGLPDRMWLGKTDLELGHAPAHAEKLSRQRRHVRETGSVVTGEVFHTSRTGALTWIEYSLSPLMTADSAFSVVGIGRNATSRRHEHLELVAAQAQIKAMFQRLVSVQEDERRRIARDLHDHLGQQLTALRMNIEVFRLLSDLDPARIRQLERTQQLADELDRSIDFLTWQLRPGTLDDLGLEAALSQMVDNWSQRSGLDSVFRSNGINGVRLPHEVEENLYRIAQESLNNIVKHAGATRVQMLLEYCDRLLRLVVADEGCGFTPADDVGTGGGTRRLGLVSMRERATLIGGALKIDTGPGRGTMIVVEVPIAYDSLSLAR